VDLDGVNVAGTNKTVNVAEVDQARDRRNEFFGWRTGWAGH